MKTRLYFSRLPKLHFKERASSMIKKYLCGFLFLVLLMPVFSQDAEIDRAKTYFAANAVQDWKSGNIDAELQLIFKNAGLKMPADRNEAFKLMYRYAPYLLKNIYLSVVVDSSHLLGNYVADGTVSLDDIVRIVEESKQTDARLNLPQDKAVMYNSAALLELSKLFVKHKKPYVPTTPPAGSVSKVYSGIIIDARGSLPVHGEYLRASLQPALFPKLWDTDMNMIFERNMVLPEIAKERRIVHFTDSLDETPYTNLVGTEPLRIVARGLFGVNRTDPIISKEDAAKILSRKENLKLIAQGRVLIICDEITKRPKYPQPDEYFYFAYRDIETIIGEDDRGITVDQNPDDQIIKITMDNVHFVADKAEILPSDYGRIDVIAEALRRLGTNVRFVIEGHTAELNRPAEQQILSEQRALAMANELAKRGIDIGRIQTLGFGATVPKAPSDTEENKAKNRRVEIKILRR